MNNRANSFDNVRPKKNSNHIITGNVDKKIIHKRNIPKSSYKVLKENNHGENKNRSKNSKNDINSENNLIGSELFDVFRLVNMLDTLPINMLFTDEFLKKEIQQ